MTAEWLRAAADYLDRGNLRPGTVNVADGLGRLPSAEDRAPSSAPASQAEDAEAA